MKVNIERIHSRLEEIYQCGRKEDGTFTRMAYSPEDVKGRETFMNYFRKLGIEPRVDEAGNIHARLEGEDPSLPAILTGSHLDTVPDGGKYDGVVGCVSGLEAVETLVENGKKLRHPLEVIVFTDEEGFRFGSGLLGSGAICGQDLDIRETDLDLYGNERGEVIKSYGITVADAPKARIRPEDVHCFIELHVEQGYRRGQPCRKYHYGGPERRAGGCFQIYRTGAGDCKGKWQRLHGSNRGNHQSTAQFRECCSRKLYLQSGDPRSGRSGDRVH